MYRFLVDHLDVQGRMLLLQQSANDMFGRQGCLIPVKKLLAEVVAVTCDLGATIKCTGAFIPRIKGVGLVSLMVANCTSADTVHRDTDGLR